MMKARLLALQDWEKEKDVCSHHQIQHLTCSLNQCNKARKRNKNMRIGKEEIKLSLFTEDVII